MGQISGAVGQLQARDSTRFPSQVEPPPKPQVNAVTLRSGKILDELVVSKAKGVKKSGENEKDVETTSNAKEGEETIVAESKTPPIFHHTSRFHHFRRL